MTDLSRRAVRTVLAVAAAATLSACGDGGDVSETADDEGPAVTTTMSGAGAPAPGGPLTVSEAMTTEASGPLLVRGYVVADGDEVTLCEVLEGTDPPSCDGETAMLEGFDVSTLHESRGTTKWSDDEVRLLVTRDGDTLTVSTTSR